MVTGEGGSCRLCGNRGGEALPVMWYVVTGEGGHCRLCGNRGGGALPVMWLLHMLCR